MKLGCYGKLCGGTSPHSVICGSATGYASYIVLV